MIGGENLGISGAVRGNVKNIKNDIDECRTWRTVSTSRIGWTVKADPTDRISQQPTG